MQGVPTSVRSARSMWGRVAADPDSKMQALAESMEFDISHPHIFKRDSDKINIDGYGQRPAFKLLG